MRSLLIFVVGAALCFLRSNGTEKAELKNVSQRKEFLAKAGKFIDEMREMLYKGNAIDNNNSTIADEKLKAYLALEKHNPKAYHVVWVIHMQQEVKPGTKEARDA